jgi:hypothetical protein
MFRVFPYSKQCTHVQVFVCPSIYTGMNYIGNSPKYLSNCFRGQRILMNIVLGDRLVHAQAVFRFIKPNVMMQNLIWDKMA